MFMSSLNLVLVLSDAVDKPPGFSPNLQVFFTLISRFFGLLGLRGLQEGLFLVKLTLSEHPILY